MPDGSRQRTSWRSLSPIRSVGRSRIDGRVGRHPQERAQVAELEAAVHERGPGPGLAERDREVEGDGRLADTALRRVDDDEPGQGRLVRGERGLVDRDDDVHELEAGERHAEHRVDAGARVAADRVLGHGQHDDGDPEAGLAELGDDLLALRPTLEEPVDDDDVGPELAGLGDGAAAVGDDVDELHLRLGAEQPAHVLGHLGDVLDEEQADRAGGGGHQADDTTLIRGSRHPANGR